MPEYRYYARNNEGKKVRGRMVASSHLELAAKLEERGEFLIQFREHGADDNRREFFFNVSGLLQRRVPKKLVASFLKQLKVFVRAGIALPLALEETQKTIAHQGLKRVVISLKTTIENGETLAEALAMYPRVFDTMLVESIRMGEESGSLPEVMDGQAERLGREAKLAGKIKTQSIYPVMLCTIVFSLLIVLNTFIVPGLMKSYENFLPQGKLPPRTEMIMGINQLIMTYGGLLPAAVFLFVLTVILSEFHPVTKMYKDQVKLKIPVLNKFILYGNLVRVCDGIRVGYNSGLPVTRILQFLEKHVGNAVLRQKVHDVRMDILNGNTFSQAVRQNPMDTVFSALVSAGEGTGNLPYTMEVGMDHYNENLDNMIVVGTTVGSFLVVIVLAAVVMFTVLSIIVPMYELPSALI